MNRTRYLTIAAAFSALAYAAVLVCRVPITSVEFLKYEPKDTVITLAGFMLGAPWAVGISISVSLIEAVTISTTGIWGFLMNVLSTLSFCLPAVVIYRRFRKIGAETAGLILGAIISAGMMMLWNWLVTPIYMGIPREAVEAMLVPVFLPFNLIKSGINVILTLILHRALSKVEKMI